MSKALICSLLLLLFSKSTLIACPQKEECSRCLKGEECVGSSLEEEPTLQAFVSFSMPEILWLQISKGLERHRGSFILKGLPNNSFQEFLTKVFELREKGMHAPISIDPDAFERYGIKAVPTFVLDQDEGFRKVVGNVTIDYALEKLQGRAL